MSYINYQSCPESSKYNFRHAIPLYDTWDNTLIKKTFFTYATLLNRLVLIVSQPTAGFMLIIKSVVFDSKNFLSHILKEKTYVIVCRVYRVCKRVCNHPNCLIIW